MVALKRICVINETKKTVVATNVVRAETFLQRLFGLMLKPDLRHGEGLLLEPCNGIHTCFMRFPIDAVFLNGNWQVVSIRRALKPWRFVPFVAGAQLVLELPAGETLPSSVEPGDFLTPRPQGHC